MSQSIINSETIAEFGIGAQNRNFIDDFKNPRKCYIKKDEWDDFELSSEINYDYEEEIREKNYFASNDMNVKIIESDDVHISQQTFRLVLKEQNIGRHYVVSDLTLKIRRSDIGDANIMDIFEYSKIEFGANEMLIISINFSVNMFLAHIHNKKIKEYDDVIEIPLVIFEMNNQDKFGGKFPLSITEHGHPKICLYMHNVSPLKQVKFSYKCFYLNDDANANMNDNMNANMNDNVGVTMFMLQSQNICTIFDDQCKIIKLPFNNQCKVLLLRFSRNDVFMCDQIKTVYLSLNKALPIVWNDEDGEIMKFRIYGENIYVVSLSPEFKSKKSLHKIISRREHGYGINFSRHESADLFVELYDDSLLNNSKVWMTVETFNVNLMRFVSGMFNTVYVNL